jgi:hypothetical protein
MRSWDISVGKKGMEIDKTMRMLQEGISKRSQDNQEDEAS